jgi:hypothetical protein
VDYTKDNQGASCQGGRLWIEGTFELARRIFTLQHTRGIALSHNFAIKPNLNATNGTGLTYAIVTDPHVVEGLVAGTRHVGIRAESIYVREGLWPD